MPETTRTFIAVAVPAALDARLARLQSFLAAEVPEGRWETPRPFHVTLAFLGDVPHPDLNAVCLAVAEAVKDLPRFPMTLQGVGAFPNAERPRTAWAGVGTPGLEPLIALQGAVVRALARHHYPPEGRPYHPHVTIGRFGYGRRPGANFGRVLRRHQNWQAGPFDVLEAITFGSTLSREGAEYAPLGRAPLRKPNRGATP